MADGLDIVAIAGGGLSILLALFLVLRGLRAPSRWVLGGLLFAFGLVTVLELLPRFLGGQWAAPMRTTLFVLHSLFIFLNLAFAVVFPAITLSPLRRTLLVLAAVPTALIAWAALANPSWIPAPSQDPTSFARGVSLLIVASHLPALWTFGQYWLTSGPSTYRSQFLYVLVPYLLWNATGAVHSVVNSFLHPETYGFALLGLAFTLSLLQGLGVFIIGIGSLVRSASASKDYWREDLRVVLLLLLAIPLIVVDLTVRNGPYIVDALLMPLLFYGGARFQIPELYVRIKTGVAAGVLGGVAFLIIFVVEQTVQYYVTDVVGARGGGFWGLMSGLFVAAVTVAAFAPLRRAARRFSERIVPNVGANDSYWTERRLHLYRVALEGVMRDKTIQPSEARALAALRDQLRVSLREHQALEAALRGAPLAEFHVAKRVRV